MKNYNKEMEKIYNNPKLYINEFANYKDDIYFWPKIIDMYKPNSILEVGIGNGRLINILHNKVKIYDGVDFSHELINYCKEKFINTNVTLYDKNFKEFRPSKKYDLIIFPFNVLNHFYDENDLKDFFTTLNKISTNNTIFIIDTINPKLENIKDNYQYKKTNTFFIRNDEITLYEKNKFNSLNSINVYYKRYILNNKIIQDMILPFRVFFKTELTLLFKYNDLEILNEYGDYNFEELNKKSRKMIFVLRRKK